MFKTFVRPYVNSYKAFLKYSEVAQKRRPLLSKESDNDFEKFLDIFILYLCRNCGSEAAEWHPSNDIIDGHPTHHSGKLLKNIRSSGEKDVFKAIISAYQVFLQHLGNPVDLELKFADAVTNANQVEIKKDLLYGTLLYFYENRNKTFIKHGLECLDKANYIKGELFPPISSMLAMSMSQDKQTYAIETDQLPFNTCFEHGDIWPWYYCGGCITTDDFIKLGGQLYLADDREHFYARSKIRMEDWCFVYNRRTERKRSLKFSVDLMRKNILEIKSTGARNIEIHVLKKFLKVVSMLTQRLTLLDLLEDN